MTPLRVGGAFRVLTASDPRSLDVLRHSGAHILATAVRKLRPDAQIGFGPSIEDGFYYDFGVSEPFTPDDLAAFEKEMRRVVAERYPFVREEVSREEAQRRFADDPLKLERIADLGAGRGDFDLYRWSVHRSVPWAARAGHIVSQAFQAAAHGRRVLARGRATSDAAADLRDRVVDEG